MKKLLVFLFAVTISILIFTPELSFALIRPSGGRTISIIPGVICTGNPPYAFTIFPPPGFFPPGPYGGTPATRGYIFGPPSPPRNILLTYGPISPTFCYIPTPAGPIPFPVFPILFVYGTSFR